MEGDSEGEHALRENTEEAVIDYGKTSFSTHTNYDTEESHRAVYVGVHVPLGREGRRRHRHRGHKHHRKRREKDSDTEAGRDSPTYDTPSQRVQFILGTEDDDVEHTPHDLFTELDELSFRDGDSTEWRETARWLKFEEDVEDGGERWSKPYVATLSLHSLFELRSCILNGTVMLDMRADSIEDIADMLIDSMVASDQLDNALRQKVREAMLKRHHHQNERKLSNRIPLVRSIADIGKKHSETLLLERNGEGLSASRHSLLKPGVSTSSLSQRRESRVSVLLNHLLPSPSPSPVPTPQSSPPSSRKHNGPSHAPGVGALQATPPQLHIPEVVVSPPTDELEDEETLRSVPPIEDEEASDQRRAQLGLLPPEGPMVTAQSVPSNLDGGKGDRRPSKSFTQVDTNFMKKIPPGAEASNVLVGEVDFLEKPIIAFVRLSPAILLCGLTEVPVPTRFLFLLLGPRGKGSQYHEIGRSMATLMTDEIFHDVAYKAKDRADLLSGIDEFLDQVTVLPPGEWDPTIRIEPPKSVPSQTKRKRPPQANGSTSPADLIKEDEHQTGPELQRTGRIFGGLILDVKRKAPFYWSDIRDSLSLQCLASILFLYCACMSPVITFGGLLGEATKGNISAIESLFGASLTGVAFSLFAGQPLTILGSTGPVLVFEKILFKFCNDYSLSYLSLRTCIGLWTAFLCAVLVATDASSLVCYITRFTEEAFAALICIIFIYEALEKLFHLGELYPVNKHNNLDNLTLYTCQCAPPAVVYNETLQVWNQTGHTSSSIPWSSLNISMCKALRGDFVGSACGHHGPYIPDVLFWSIILFFSTFLLSSFLKQFKTERYFPTKVRATISDFAVFLTIMVMVLVDFLMGIPTPKLHVPDRFEPTSKNRGWLIDPLGENPWWTVPAASVPALLCTILIFMDQQITAVIVNRKEHKLKKGCGYHLDLFIVAVMLGVCSVMGLPWFVAATVLSISHVNSLKVESGCSAPGEQPKFLGIREQRVTGLMIFVLMGLSVFMTSALKFIPMPVLYGVFLYMGVSSLKGIQFFDRIKLFGMPAKHQPDLIYLRYVPLWKVHIFTLVQLTCLALLWGIKASAAAVVFPMMVLALVFIRKLLDFFFTKRELSWLDDLMPESKKKTEDDKKKRKQEEQRRMEEEEEAEGSTYGEENLLKIPIQSCSGSTDLSFINITEEINKSESVRWRMLRSSDRFFISPGEGGVCPGEHGAAARA
ncbi:sodium bicarbonate cotransporter 3-like isoform X2 [Denticeps clupeoides]|uniref:Anion exchange protein n=1 Tax=Denticeps clupeoides TaxID=299321 RepID=A0AAY4CBP1_9TELE|nr:sodium bicarbonate cotransporter 3-like isoform X2 [Denticeps clupeoides]XP_028819290.1 sodium bicarbonate cotransporter 3-like isoform X2 [Denticeps clupeoides]XP_028819291.1 sodium bicarbonate cotransporter 3-like isoform X2 [Denticeps clupeoides]XP_028819293.1 sodium bicarbonate cotransporter 3-like isoform X2 [Denticeps clupeoides]